MPFYICVKNDEYKFGFSNKTKYEHCMKKIKDTYRIHLF